MRPIRVMVVDDHVYYREGIKTLLATRDAEVTVVAEATDGEQACDLVESVPVDVVLMDLKMPGMGGIEATRRLVAHDPSLTVLVLTMNDDDSVLPALRAGARGFLLKDATVDELVLAIIAVDGGASMLGPEAAARVQKHLLHGPARPRRALPGLTEREQDVLDELLQGSSNREIALALSLSEKTVRNYVSNILLKLGARDRSHLIVIARDAGQHDG